MTRTRTLAFAAALLAPTAVAGTVAAQQPAPNAERIGHIVAIVGDSAVLNFDLQNAVLARQAAGQPIPEEGPAREQFMRDLLDERINELVLVQAALRDTTIVVQEDALNRVVQAEIDERQRALGGPAAFETALLESGMTLSAFRDMLVQQQRRRALIDQYVARSMSGRKPPPVTERDLREGYEGRRGQLERRPPTITFQQVVVRTQPSAEADARVRARADSIFERIRNRENFEQLARIHSEDGTRERGGDLGFFRRSDMVREFASVAFSLRPGDVSAPVRTQFGYHIIKVERVRGAEVQARHILLKHELTEQDAFRARARADTVAERLRAGANAAELSRQYGDRDEQVRIGPFPLEQAGQMLRMDLSQAQAGEVLGPVPIGGEQIAAEFIVVKVLEREAAREWSLDDTMLRDNLRQTIERQKMFDELLQDLRRRTYIEVRSP
jgi:peptidyl-prolyl cis-trans isomerase SurA